MDDRSLTLLLLIGLVTFAEGAKILCILPTGGKSHDIIGTAFMRPLAEAGHDVTVVTAYPTKNKPANYREIVLTGLLEEYADQETNMFDMQGGLLSAIVVLGVLYEMFPSLMHESVMKHPNVVNLRNSDEKFDVVIVESFVAESFYGFAQHFDAHLITFSAFGNSMWTNDLVGTPAPPSHIAHFMLSFTDRMTFWQRFVNTAFTMLDRVYYEWFYLPSQKRYYDEAFPNAKRSFEQQMKNVSLVFLNQHFTLTAPRPYAANMVEVGGIQIDEPKPLPEDLKKYLDEADNGVIYFCMGSNIQSKHLPEDKRDAFLQVFSKLKLRVLWKFENESIPNQPANLMIKSWMPQNDILAHPNVKLFITHGGNLGTTESLYHGKPMVGIPIFGDQMMNVEKSVRAGYAVLLNFNDINEATVSHAINTVLNDPSYERSAQLTSARYRDKPMSAKQTAVYWVEYVLRHGGAPQLRSPAMELSLWQYHLIDVYAVMLVLLICVGAGNVYVGKKIYRKVFPVKPLVADKKKRA
ncbi:UDP-glycosyltransferase UGT5-like [Topomyia yanbarensis]|uniref:UDP-glycosyltransferase UGT5-like n=1 Tax=Topomyia yanbarensis TaxID=2498891 RepID=UPI00273B7E5D|nr:UDP-glycosyltransferase UGT5-like [Topomyia yanbarensis]